MAASTLAEEAMVSRHLLQDAVDELPTCFMDAFRLELMTASSLKAMVEERRRLGQAGNGAPPAWNKSLNRAVVVAAVGAWEAYMETLALKAVAASASTRRNWVTISGTNGDIQTPSSTKVRKLFWMLFGLDLQQYWQNVKVQVADSELSADSSGTWRTKWRSVSGEDAARLLDGIVKVRHGFAHGDPGQTRAEAGIAVAGAVGRVTVQSHHAFNAVSALLQLSLLSTAGLAAELELPDALNWSSKLKNVTSGYGLEHWLAGTSIEEAIKEKWRGTYPTGAEANAADASPLADLDPESRGIPVIQEPDDDFTFVAGQSAE